jgi:hypothetical protein
MNIDQVKADLENLLPQPEARQAALQLLGEYIQAAHRLSPDGWVVYIYQGYGLVFQIRNMYTFTIGHDLSGKRFTGIVALVDKDSLTDDDRHQLVDLGCGVMGGFKSAAYGQQVQVYAEDKDRFLQALPIVRRTFPAYLQKALRPGIHTPFKKQYQPEVIEYLEQALETTLPRPGYSQWVLNAEQLSQFVREFAAEISTSTELQAHLQEHARRSQRAQELLSLERIPTLSEDDLRELFLDTDAYGFWRNKERYFRKRIEKTGLEGYRQALLKLISRAEEGLTPDDLAEALKVHGLGPLLISELLTYRFPDTYYTYSEGWTLELFRAWGVDAKIKAPRGQQSTSYLYFALEPPINQVRIALQEAVNQPVDNPMVDIFLWWLDRSGKVKEPESQQLARVLAEGKRNAKTRPITRAFLDRVETALRSVLSSIEADVGLRARSDDRPRGYQYLDRAYFYLPVSDKSAHRLALWVLLLHNKLWWGFAHWGTQEMAERLLSRYQSLGLQRQEEKPIVAPGAVGSPPAWQGGYHFAVGEELPAEKVAEQPDLDTLAGQIAADLEELYTRLSPYADRLQLAVKGDASPPESLTPGAMRSVFESKGFRFTDLQIATFFTALQTKGFVILSGISGTGKTKLAQHFAALMPERLALVGALSGPFNEQDERLRKQVIADYWTYPVRSDVQKDLRAPFRLYLYHQGTLQYFFNVVDYQTQAGDQGMETPWPDITAPELHGRTYAVENPNMKFKTWFRMTGYKKLDTPLRLIDLNVLFNYQPVPQALIGAFLPVLDPLESNLLFVSVRPDWRDGKSLLGYFNPLLKRYEWTPFLHFILKAREDYERSQQTAQPWFVILDEMNLARVEYYFSDLLSVLESGRDADGWTREPVRLESKEGNEGDPPAEIRLPPNLYIIGTVNVDETTHAFSPKVLDRAFTLELTEADFTNYHPDQLAAQSELNAEQRQSLLQVFSNDGQFAVIDKEEIGAYLAGHPELRGRLQNLNTLLKPHELHFGYRVFDEIVAFLAAAEHNTLFAGLGGNVAAFDAAVVMKVLPKFHGSRGKLEEPLKKLLAWCLNPDSPDRAAIDAPIKADQDPSLAILVEQSLCPATAERAVRMLRSLYTSGFASFG